MSINIQFAEAINGRNLKAAEDCYIHCLEHGFIADCDRQWMEASIDKLKKSLDNRPVGSVNKFTGYGRRLSAESFRLTWEAFSEIAEFEEGIIVCRINRPTIEIHMESVANAIATRKGIPYRSGSILREYYQLKDGSYLEKTYTYW